MTVAVDMELGLPIYSACLCLQILLRLDLDVCLPYTVTKAENV